MLFIKKNKEMLKNLNLKDSKLMLNMKIDKKN